MLSAEWSITMVFACAPKASLEIPIWDVINVRVDLHHDFFFSLRFSLALSHSLPSSLKKIYNIKLIYSMRLIFNLPLKLS